MLASRFPGARSEAEENSQGEGKKFPIDTELGGKHG